MLVTFSCWTTITEVDWAGMFNGKSVINKGASQYYDYDTGRVISYPSWTRSGAELYPAVEPRFLSEE